MRFSQRLIQNSSIALVAVQTLSGMQCGAGSVPFKGDTCQLCDKSTSCDLAQYTKTRTFFKGEPIAGSVILDPAFTDYKSGNPVEADWVVYLTTKDLLPIVSISTKKPDNAIIVFSIEYVNKKTQQNETVLYKADLENAKTAECIRNLPQGYAITDATEVIAHYKEGTHPRFRDV